jgi:hypothetical protein
MKVAVSAVLSLSVFTAAALSLSSEARKQTAPPLPLLAQAPVPAEADDLPVIGQLENRSRVITVKAGPAGAVYSVATKDGKTLHNNVTLDELKAQAPDLYNFVQNSYAGIGLPARLKVR